MGDEVKIGHFVQYKLSQGDVDEIQRRRTTNASIRERIGKNEWPIGAQAHIGNPVVVGEIVPAIVVAVFGETTVNLQCFLDGCDTFWALSRLKGDQPAQWSF